MVIVERRRKNSEISVSRAIGSGCSNKTFVGHFQKIWAPLPTATPSAKLKMNISGHCETFSRGFGGLFCSLYVTNQRQTYIIFPDTVTRNLPKKYEKVVYYSLWFCK